MSINGHWKKQRDGEWRYYLGSVAAEPKWKSFLCGHYLYINYRSDAKLKHLKNIFSMRSDYLWLSNPECYNDWNYSNEGDTYYIAISIKELGDIKIPIYQLK